MSKTQVAPSVDLDYQANFRKSQAAQNLPTFVNWRGDNQYIWVYSRTGFYHGAYYGSFAGLASAVYYRKLHHIPLYAIGSGVAYAAFHASSAYFRNEI